MSKTKSTSPKKLDEKKLQKLKAKYQEQLNAVFAESDAVETESGNDSIQMRVAELEATLVRQPAPASLPLSAEAPSESEERWRLLSEASSEGVLIHDNGKIVNANIALGRIFGYENPNELVGHSVLEFVAPESQAVVIDYIRAGKEEPYELIGLRRDGTRISVESTGRTIKSQGKNYRAATIRDITTWKHAEEELFKFKMGIEQSNDAIFITDTEGRITYANLGFEKVYGFTREEAVGQTPRIIKSGVIPAEQYKNFWAALLSKNVVAGEIVNKHKDGRLLNIQGANNPIVNANGQIIGFLAIHHDISDRKQTETRLMDAIEHLDSGFVMYGPDERLIVSNTRYKELYPKSAHLMTPDMPYEDILHESYRQGNYTHTGLSEDEWVANRLALHRATKDRNSYEQKVGERWIRIDDARSSDGGVVSLRTDITADKQAEEVIRTSESNLAEALRLAKLANWEFDFVNNQFVFNDAFYALFHTTAEREGGYRLTPEQYSQRFVHPEDIPIVVASIERVMASRELRQSIVVEHRILYADGGVGFVAARINVDKDDQGNLLRYYGANQDITEPHQAEEALRTSEANLAEALRVARLGNWEYDFVKDEFTFNDDFYAMMRTTADREGGYKMNAARYTERFVYPEDAPIVGAEIGKSIETTDPNFSTQVDHRVIFGDGEVGYVSVRFRIEKNAEGRTIRSFGANQDINERKQAEALNTKRAAELQAVAEISTAASTATNTQEMLQKVVDMTQESMGFYHAHIYLLDETNTNLVLTAGAGEVGKKMVSAGRSIPLNHPNSLVARAARTRIGTIVNDVTKEKDFLPNPLLPNTRSELATPILVGNTVLGVFDVQADSVDRFSQEDVAIETTLARQIGAALQNVRSLEQSAKTLSELDRLNRRLVREGWQDYQERTQSSGHFVYQLPQTIKSGSTEPLLKSVSKTISAPLAVRGEVIGELALTDSAETEGSQDIIHAIAERLSAQIENLRLSEQTQVALAETSKRAIEVQAVSEVTTAASTILERDQLLEKAVHLTQRRFNLYHCHVFLYDPVTHNLSINACGWREGDPHEGTHGKRIIPLTQEKSLVAQAARDRQPIIANDVTKSSTWLANELLPDTRSEVAIPMTVGDTLIGVFDVQSEKVNRFSDEDVRTFATLASAVAVATQNANLYAEQAAIVARLKDVDQLKSSFLANMSHELRTPLNSVIGFTEVLLEGIDGELTEPMENDLKVIHKNGQHLLNLINDVLDMAKIEAGRMTLTIEEFNLQEVIEEVTQITRPLADVKSIELRMNINVNEDLTLEADRIRMRQVMINVVNNSIKFTETGYVAIDAERTADFIKVTVTDTGVGIPVDHLDKIFQEFTQVDTSTTRKAGGTGLGLPISRHLVDLHGGRLWAESTGIAGEGSVFHIELPIIAKEAVE